MPRGKRNGGQAGARYPNRTDKQGPPQPQTPGPPQAQAQGARTPTGLPYGEHQKMQQAQRAMPLENAQAQEHSALANALGAIQSGGMGGEIGGFDRPSEIPDEPITSGMDIGQGAGSDVLPMQHSNPFGDQQARDLENLRRRLPALEYMASRPEASQSSRNFVRRLRSLMPPQGGLPQ